MDDAKKKMACVTKKLVVERIGCDEHNRHNGLCSGRYFVR